MRPKSRKVKKSPGKKKVKQGRKRGAKAQKGGKTTLLRDAGHILRPVLHTGEPALRKA